MKVPFVNIRTLFTVEFLIYVKIGFFSSIRKITQFSVERHLVEKIVRLILFTHYIIILFYCYTTKLTWKFRRIMIDLISKVKRIINIKMKFTNKLKGLRLFNTQSMNQMNICHIYQNTISTDCLFYVKSHCVSST